MLMLINMKKNHMGLGMISPQGINHDPIKNNK
jgi:hypothetical protein